MQPKRVIVSADDFGMSPGINEAVLRAHTDGVLTDTSLMVNGAAADEAIALARAAPRLSVGLHLVLAQGRATLPPREIPDLVDGDGFFRDQEIRAALGYFFTPGVRAQVRREIAAQIEKFLASGLPLSHVDGHVNIHMHPTILNILLELAERYNIRALRLTFEPLRAALQIDPRHAARKIAEGLTFAALSSYARPRMDARRIRHPDRLFGLHRSGHLTESYLLQLLSRIEPGVTEIYCHPARLDAEVRRWRPADYESEAELVALTSARIAERIQELSIALTSYRELVSGAA
ncbi:MAG TPA: hopanoid biosynthesis-associated protein HpnK [Candidatus Binatia bacterium]|nr:hopanoid biosynthesis-associated protein HpnK [Candidatus Binatia bacterium]